MLDKVCCIVDFDGFDIKVYDDDGRRYSNEFLVRELGYLQIDTRQEFSPQSYHFDLRQKIDPARCSQEVRTTLQYQSRNVLGLSILPSPFERNVVQYHFLEEIVEDIHNQCRTPTADVVAYKGGIREENILQKLNIPSVDLQDFGCPKYATLLDSGQVYSKLQDCGYHSNLNRGRLIHCPRAEVTAFRDWYMLNYKTFRPSSTASCRSGACHSTGNFSALSSARSYAEAYLWSDSD